MEYGRKLDLENLLNTRDLGGFPAAGNKTVRSGRLIRSGELYPASADDIGRLSSDYRLKLIIDFRTGQERRQKPDPAVEGAAYVENPILDEAALGITREEESGRGRDWLDETVRIASAIRDEPSLYMDRMYENLAVNPHARRQYGKFLRLLSSFGGDGAVLWHCTAGKDRVGTGTALLLSALGVDRRLIVEDYMKTNDYYREQNEAMSAEVLRRTGDPKTAGSAVGLYSVKETYILSVFRAAEEKFGTAGRYLRDGLGLSDAELDRLKSLYLE